MSGAYGSFHRNRMGAHLYPTEFVVRTMLGTYPGLRMARDYDGRRLLDLGFGDGRNFPLFAALGVRIYGVEPEEEVCTMVAERVERLGIPCELRGGNNAHIPYPDALFDYVVACHSMYYVLEGESFSDNVTEVARVMKPGGWLIASVPDFDNFILQGSDDLGDGHRRVRRDPYDLRNGSVLRGFGSTQEVESAFAPAFVDFSFGAFHDDWYGILVSGFIVVARRSD